MSATLSTEPTSPASAYRPLAFMVQRSDPSGSQVISLAVATSEDVSSLGNGIEVGQILIQHADIQGDVPIAAGQAIILNSTCAPYDGTWHVTNAFDDGSDHWITIDATDLGTAALTGPPTAKLNIFLEDYTIWARVNIYTDPAGSPQQAILEGHPDSTGATWFHPDVVIRDYFNHDISAFAMPVAGDQVVQDAHGVSALFYKMDFAETYYVPDGDPVLDPFDGDHDVSLDTDFRVAVNAIHPYDEWSTADLDAFVVDDSSSLFMTDAPRELSMNASDRFRLHMLTNEADSYATPDTFNLLIYDLSGAATLVLTKAIVLPDVTTSAVSIACGPADLAPYVTVPSKYRVRLNKVVTDGPSPQVCSEDFIIRVSTDCEQVRRPMAWLNLRGGIDHYTFNGNEIETPKAKTSFRTRPYGTGTGQDWTADMYRSDVQNNRTLVTKPLAADVREWLVKGWCRAAKIVLRLSDSRVARVVRTSEEGVTYNTKGQRKPLVVEYYLGSDNVTQQG